jgi:predicted DNA-binding WGR domain protein
MTNQFGAGKCTLCGSSGTSKTTCPLNPDSKNPNPQKHPLANKSKSKVLPKDSKLLQLKGPGSMAQPSMKPSMLTMKIKKKTMKKSKSPITTLTLPSSIKSKSKKKSSNNFHRLEFKEGNSSKFWQIKSVGTDVETNWGKIGTKGSTKVMKFDSKDKANIYIEKQLQSKIKKGYKEINKSPNSKPKDNWNLLPGDIKVKIMNINKEAEKKEYAKFYNIIDKIDPDNDGYEIDDKYDNDKHFINVINGLKKTILKDLKFGDILFVGTAGGDEYGFIMYLDNDIYYGENGYSGPIRYLKDCREEMGKEKECEKMKTIRYSKLVIDLQDNNQEMYGLFGGDWLGLDDIKEQYEAVNLWD